MRILVDGYNLLHVDDRLRAFMRFDREAARSGLLAMLGDYKKARGHKIVCVFDGVREDAPHAEARTERGHGVTVVFSGPGRSADDAIVALCASGEGRAVVVTSDRALGARVEALGAEAVKSKVFYARMIDAKFGAPPGEEDAPPAPKEKKGPSRRLKKKDRPKARARGKL